MTPTVLHGDCLEILPTLEAESFHACVCDPPYHLTSIVKRFGGENAAPAQFGKDGAFARASRGFMGKQWDGGDIALRPETWAEVLRVLKPGAHLLAFGGTRTFHRMAVAIEDAGFEIRDTVMWLYGSGFPKSHNQPGGWGTALKPAWEPIVVARKALIGTVAANVLAHGAGAINIDGCRISLSDTDPLQQGIQRGERIGRSLDTRNADGSWGFKEVDRAPGLGRWPANVMHDGSAEVEAAFAAFGESTSSGGSGEASQDFTSKNGIYGQFGSQRRAHAGGLGDTGTPSRYFYSAKADASDRAGSKHPTVKPLDLMRYLVRLVTPPGGHVLDCFAGSGSTGEAAMLEGFRATLIEREAEYVTDIRRRLGRASGADTPLFASAP